MTLPDVQAAIVDDLFFEQENEVLGSLYRHGLLRTIFVVCRSVLFSRPAAGGADSLGAPGSTLAVVFFKNELHAITHAAPGVRIDKILKLDITSLGLIRAELGLGTVLSELLYFLRVVTGRKGRRYIPRVGIPCLGWLLYKTFVAKFGRGKGLTVITTNMQHPTSIAVQWAAHLTGQSTVFVEHATTPALVFKDRGYDHYYVNFEHTRQMMVTKGAAPASVHVMGDFIGRAQGTADARIRCVGICINDLDSFESVADITDVLQQHGLQVSYRLHDADPRLSRFRTEARRLGIGFSSARATKISDYLAEVDLVVAGNSNVVADALKAGKRVIYYWPGRDELFDYYGIVKYYDLPHARTRQALEILVGALLGHTPAC